MRALFSLGLLVAVAGSAAAQDTSVVIRGTSDNGKMSGDTTITIRRPGQPDRVIKLGRSTNAELRAQLERQLQESRRGFAGIREMQAGALDRARREAESAGEMRSMMLEGRPARPEGMGGGVMFDRIPLMVEGERATEARAGGTNNVIIERRPATVDGQRIAELRELNSGAVTMARRAQELASRSLQAFVARPRIGITVDLNARDSDKYGAYVSAVTPGGPAAKAGLRTADIIMSIAGKSLTVPDSIRRGVDESAPGLRLIELVARLEVGKAVPLEIRRGNDTRKLSITPDDDPTLSLTISDEPIAGAMMVPRSGGTGRMVWSGRLNPDDVTAEPRVPAQFFKNFERAGAGGNFGFVFGTALADLELAPVNEKLGSYFGVSEGVLVIDVPAKGSLGLVPGDVVTAVDGRKVTNPGQLMRILGTYERNEEFKLQVTRQKRTETVTAKLP